MARAVGFAVVEPTTKGLSPASTFAKGAHVVNKRAALGPVLGFRTRRCATKPVTSEHCHDYDVWSLWKLG
jgi:hypothetical protein